MRDGLTKTEQETIILFNELDAEASVYTHNIRLKNTLNRLCHSHPLQVKKTNANACGGTFYVLPKKWVKITAPRVLSNAQRDVLERMNRKHASE